MKFSYILFVLSFLNIAVLLLFSEEVGDRFSEGKCFKLVSYRVSRRVPYQETYKHKILGIFWQTRVRWNYRIEYTTQYRRDLVCCTGYWMKSYTGSYIQCEPNCPSTCKHGSCIKPNECKCDKGYSNPGDLVFESLCVPVCTHTCVYGRCTAPEVCTCNHGYSMNAVTHTCEPVCTLPCLEGSYCSKPDYCDCLDGYVHDSELKLIGLTKNTFCIPVCEKKCINGKCTAPNICTCNRGYKPDPDDAFVCLPECEHGCIFGTCTAPNVCTCDHGYTLKSPSVCEPICSEACVMGTCIAPESCSCFAGYGLFEDSKYNCVPICEKICLNGKCTAPDVCTCNKGFRSSENELEKHICKPHCEIPCEPFGVCTAPNVCTCFEGYRLADKTQTKKIDTQYFARYALPDNSICKPVCDAECINGFCSAPNTCNCYYGYHPSDNNADICEPTCSQNCVNSFCSSPENCTCIEGYRPSKNTSSNNICEPFCESDCINGYCSAPNKCSCNANYRPSEGNRTNLCEPICNPSCKNGICIRPNVCDCNPGYNQSTHSMNECEPICHPACGTHGICEEPDRCVCENGYRMVYYDDKDVPFMCSPICNVNCGNGTCAAPNLCTCFDGYQTAETGRCEPVCSMCNNGTCVAPDICECDDGFVLEDAKIDIEVSDIEISEFKDRQSNGSKCIPYCESCDNGECVAPGECRCHAGFVEIEGTCMHACRDGCGTHGKCIDERRFCECDYGWSGLRCDRPTMCISILNNVENRTDQLNIVEERNATIDQIFMNSPNCSQCSDKINNETLCFKMYINDTEDDTQIGCLINAECFALSQYMDQKKIIELTAIAGVGILILLGTAITTYILLQKRRNREMGDEQVADHSTSMQKLLEQNTNTS